MSCNTTRNEDGGVTVTIDRPELSLHIIFRKDGEVEYMDHHVKEGKKLEKIPNEYVCNHRGEVTKTVSCCGGKTRPTEIECKSFELPDRIPFGTCNSIYCKFYEAPERQFPKIDPAREPSLIPSES